jgi:superfamily II DNA/RNA helicase
VLSDSGKEETSSDHSRPLAISAVAGFRELAKFVSKAGDYLLEGNEADVEEASTNLESAIRWFSTSGMSFETWFGDRLEFIFGQMVDRSIWRKLYPLMEKRPQYLEALVSDEVKPVVELWSSQIAALKQMGHQGTRSDFLGETCRRYVVSMPTGAGKTRIAEILIADAIDPDEPSTCIYVAPTKALVNQVATDLSKMLTIAGYRIATAVGAYESVPGLDEVLVEDSDILVTTPEKLDMLVRIGAPTIKRATLFVFDECHKVEDAGRGLRLELLISRLLNAYADAGFVMLSAVLPHSNLGEFVNWLGSDRPIEFYWRPTRLLEGVVTWRRGEEITDNRSKRERYQAHYSVNYPDLFETESLLKGTFFADNGSLSKNRWEVAAELALCYAELGPVLIYCPTRSFAQNTAKKFLQPGLRRRLPDPDTDREPSQQKRYLMELVEDRLGEDFPLGEMVRLGVAYHHAQLPADVKTEIERAVRNGEITILTSTTTLAEGVNLPVRTVIFADVLYAYWDLEKNKRQLLFQIDPKQFRNIAGRAGRALQDTEGHAILVDFYTLQELYSGYKYSLDHFEVKTSFREAIRREYAQNPRAGTQKLYLGREKVENSPVRSRFFDLVGAIQKKREEDALEEDDELLLGDEQTKASEEERLHQSEVLAIICEQEGSLDQGLIPSPSDRELNSLAQSIMSRTLFAQQIDLVDPTFEDAVHLTQRHTRAVYRREQSQRLLYNQTGLSLQSCERLDSFVANLVDRFIAGDLPVLGELREDGDLQFERIEEVLRCVRIPSETQPEPEGDLQITTSHERVLFDWIVGRSVPEILRDNFGVDNREKYDSEAKREKQILAGANYIYSHLVNFASWALGATTALLKSEFEERGILNFDAELWLLPAYALYGVDSPIALFCTAMGVDDRDVARGVLDEQYPLNILLGRHYAAPDWANVKWWFSNLRREALEKWISRPRKLQATWEAVLDARKRFAIPEGFEDAEYYVTSCPVRGLLYEDRFALLPELYPGYVLKLRREVSEFDPNAIQVVMQDDRVLGYIPRELAALYAPLIDAGGILYATVDFIEERRVRIHIFEASE